MSPRYIFVLCVVAVIFAHYASATSCEFTLDGEDYDFNDVRANTDYSGTDSDGYTYKMNVCGNAKESSCSSRQGSVCQYSSDGSEWMLGSWTGSPNPVWSLIDAQDPGKGVMLTYTNGDDCSVLRTVMAKFNCADEQSNKMTVAEVQACVYEMNLDTPAACIGGMSGGTIFLIIFASCVAVYIAGGCAFNYKSAGLVGVEACPQIEFWRTLPGLVKDGTVFFIDFVKSKMNKGGSTAQYEDI